MSVGVNKELEKSNSLCICNVYIHLKSGSVIKTRNYRNGLHSLTKKYEEYCKNKTQSTFSYYLLDRPDTNNPACSAEICINFENIEAIFISELDK